MSHGGEVYEYSAFFFFLIDHQYVWAGTVCPLAVRSLRSALQ